MTKKISDGCLSMQQKMFCKCYIEEGGNATRAYIKAYKSGNENSARKLASRLLSKPPIKDKINRYLEEAGLNNTSVGMELLKVIKQDQNLWAKLGGIKEFNKMTHVYEKRVEPIQSSISEEDKKRVDRFLELNVFDAKGLNNHS